MTDQSTNVAIGEFANLNQSCKDSSNMTDSIPHVRSAQSDSSPARGLLDLPAELLHHVTGYLWIEEHHADWYDAIEEFRYQTHGHKARIQMRKDVLALSSCSKDLRRLVSRGALLKEVTVKLDGKELLELASMSEDLRCCVK